MKTTIVTTTINIPTLLEKYSQDAKEHGHSSLSFVVIGDRKSPAGTREFCDGIAKRYYPCEYLDIEDQRKYLARFPRLWEHLAFDSIQRRNIGVLKAWEDGADVMVTIDDDNWPLDADLLRLHGRVGREHELPGVESSSGWFNVCSFLAERDGIAFYHRGYPWDLRWRDGEATTSTKPIKKTVVVNAGFWTDDPDIDALARMNRQPYVTGFRPDVPHTFALKPGTWSPFNSQNTALMRDAIPAYFLSPYCGRYDDIWASYIVTRIAQHLDHVVAFGEPLVEQKRNPHDLWKDLDVERAGMIMTPGFCKALRAIQLDGKDYHACFGEILQKLPAAWPEEPRWNDALKQCRTRLFEGLEIWHEVFEKLR